MLIAHRFPPFVLPALLFLCLIAALSSPALAADNRQGLEIFVSILPEVYFVEQIGGERVHVSPLVLPGQSPATYAPTARQLATLSRADLYFRIGVPFEKALLPRLKKTMPELRIVDLRKGLELISRPGKKGNAVDPHIWLDPSLVAGMSETIHDELVRLDPDGAPLFARNLHAFMEELKRLDRQLKGILTPLAGTSLYVFHPAYAYFCRAYHLQQKPIAPDGKMPGSRYLTHLIDQARQDRVQAIFVQPQFSSKAARALADRIGARLVPLDPLAPDYITNLLTMGQRIAEALQSKEKPSQPK